MKATVLRPFRDKHTKEVYKKGQVIDVTEKRLAEINKNLGGGFIEAAPPAEPATAEKPKRGRKKSKSG